MNEEFKELIVEEVTESHVRGMRLVDDELVDWDGYVTTVDRYASSLRMSFLESKDEYWELSDEEKDEYDKKNVSGHDEFIIDLFKTFDAYMKFKLEYELRSYK